MIRAPGHTAPAEPLGLRLGYPVLAGLFRARGLGSLRSQRAVLVYQMAKVGSYSVVRSLRASRPRPRVFHVHTLTPSGIAAMERFYRRARAPSLPAAGHLLVSRYLREQLLRGVLPGRWKVVTLVRDPIARNISLIFQLGRRLIPDFAARCRAGRLDPVQLFGEFEAAFPEQIDCLRWFRDELFMTFGVDPFAQPFDRTAGYQVYRGPIADVLLLRTEDLDRCGASALQSFLGVDVIRWRRSNVRAHKAYGTRYTGFLGRLALPLAYVDRVYSAPEVRQFYAPDELDRFRERWCGAVGAVA